MFQGRNVLGVRELAALCTPWGPGTSYPRCPARGPGSVPVGQAASGGAHVGNTVGGRTRQVHFTDDTTGRHHLYMARTRMGKSTLMQHVVLHKMREKAAGRNHDAIIVIDPHADLVHDLLEQVPEEIIDRVYLIDLADDTQAPGINLVDVKVFPDRDRTANSVVRVAKGMWEHWGSGCSPSWSTSLRPFTSTTATPNERRPAAHHPGRAAAAGGPGVP